MAHPSKPQYENGTLSMIKQVLDAIMETVKVQPAGDVGIVRRCCVSAPVSANSAGDNILSHYPCPGTGNECGQRFQIIR